MKKVIVYGNTILSEMLYYDAYGDESFEISAFAVDSEYLSSSTFLGLPQVDVADIFHTFPPCDYDLIAPYTSIRQLRDREIFYHNAKAKGYFIRNYISKKADVSPDIILGDNNLIFAQSHIGVKGKMGSNNIVRQQVYMGHDFEIGNHNVFSPASNVAAHCKIGNLCYIGIGATVIDHIKMADETLLGAASLLIKDSEAYSKNVGNPSKVIGYHSEEGIRIGGRK